MVRIEDGTRYGLLLTIVGFFLWGMSIIGSYMVVQKQEKTIDFLENLKDEYAEAYSEETKATYELGKEICKLTNDEADGMQFNWTNKDTFVRVRIHCSDGNKLAITERWDGYQLKDTVSKIIGNLTIAGHDYEN